MIWSTIRSIVRLKLNDNSKIWSDADLLSYANEGQRELTIGCEASIKKVKFDMTDGQRQYTFPPDCYELRNVRINGRRVYGTTNQRLEELDEQYLTATGVPSWYYVEDLQTIGFYPLPTWTDDYETFDADLGLLISAEVDDVFSTFSSDLGVGVSALDTTGAQKFIFDGVNGVIIQANNAGYVCELTYVYTPADIAADGDTPDMPRHIQYGLIDYILNECFSRQGRGNNPTLAAYFGGKYKEIQTEWFSKNKTMARGEAQMLSQKTVSWGSDLRWRERVWP